MNVHSYKTLQTEKLMMLNNDLCLYVLCFTLCVVFNVCVMFTACVMFTVCVMFSVCVMFTVGNST